MNCPAKTDPVVSDGHNQNPDDLCSDLTTRNDLGKVANARLQREHRLSDPHDSTNAEIIAQTDAIEEDEIGRPPSKEGTRSLEEKDNWQSMSQQNIADGAHANGNPETPIWRGWLSRALKVPRTYCKFIGPGFMVSVVSHVKGDRFV